MKFTKATAAGAVAIALTFAATGCGSGGSGAASGDSVTIAVAGPLTGDNGIYGQDQYAGIEFAAKELNAAGGIPSGPLKGKKIKVIKFDDAADPNQGASVAQKICDNSSVMAAFGHSNSSVTLAAEPIYERCGVPLYVSYSSNPAITAKVHKNLFRVLSNDAQMGGEMASFSKSPLGFKKVGIIASGDDYGAGLKASFEETAKKVGLPIAKVVTTSAGQKDFTPQLTDLRNAGADALVLLNTYTDAALQIKQAYAMGWHVPSFVTPGSNSPELVNIAGAKAAEGTIVAAVFDPNSSKPGPAKFVKDFTSTMGHAPGESSATAYDAFYVFLDALEQGAKDRASVISETAKIGTFDLPIRGKLTFNDVHDPTVVPGQPAQVLLQVKNGKIVSYSH